MENIIKILLSKGYSTKALMKENYLEIDASMEEENVIHIIFEKSKDLIKVIQRIWIDLSKERIVYSYTPNMWTMPQPKVISKKSLIEKLKALPSKI